MQLYTDMGEYRRASYFWEMKTKYSSEQQEEIPSDFSDRQEIASKDDGARRQIDLQTYSELFVGREDTYVREISHEGKQRATEQIMEPITDEVILQHLEGKAILGTYVQRPNSTAKYVVFDLDISKKILLQYSYGSDKFASYKQKAAEYAGKLCRVLKKMGMTGYVEDTGYRGYHVWVFFTEWIPVRYLNRFTDCVKKELKETEDDIVMEVFPNNGRVRQGKCGQSIKLPLGVHIRTGNRSFFLDRQYQTV